MQTSQPSTEEKVDVGVARVARVYAEALLNAADKAGQVEGVMGELDSLVKDVFPSRPEIATLIASSAIGPKHRLRAIQQAFQGRASAIFFNFLQVLNDHERMDLLNAVNEEVRKLHDERQRRVRVFATTAVPLNDDEKRRIADRVRQEMGQEALIENVIDPSILGGMVLRVKDWQFDGSIRTRIENLRQQILTRSSHEIQSRRDRFCTADGN